MGQPHILSGSACSSYCTCVSASIAIGHVWRSFNGRTRKYRRPLSTQHDLYCSDYWKYPPEYREQAARGHRGRRPLSLKKGGRSEARPAQPRRTPRLARQRLGPGTSRGRPGARHPPLRGDSATPGRLPAALRRRLDHDGQARSTRPERALLPGFFGLGQPTWAGGAAGHICRGCSEDAGPWARSIGPWASIVQSHVHRTATSLPSPADWPEGHQIGHLIDTTSTDGRQERSSALAYPLPVRYIY